MKKFNLVYKIKTEKNVKSLVVDRLKMAYVSTNFFFWNFYLAANLCIHYKGLTLKALLDPMGIVQYHQPNNNHNAIKKHVLFESQIKTYFINTRRNVMQDKRTTLCFVPNIFLLVYILIIVHYITECTTRLILIHIKFHTKHSEK